MSPLLSAATPKEPFLRELEGGCQVPIGVNTVIEGDTLTLTGIVASLDGQQLIKDTVTGSPADAESMGNELAKTSAQSGRTGDFGRH